MRTRQTRHTTTQGILHPEAVERTFHLLRALPSPDLRRFVDRYWIVSWDLRGQQPHTQETLPYPCAHLVFEAGNTTIVGVMTGKFTRLLEGRGQVFGIKFQPAGFYPFARRPMRSLTNQTLPCADIFGVHCDALESAILAQPDERAQVALVEGFLRACLPEPDERVATLNHIVADIAADRDITTVEQVLCHCARGAMSKRTLQRLFSEYIGVGPKWVIRRFRLHEAAGRIDAGDAIDWPRTALELGYADQTHFIKDFKAIVGKTPAEYSRQRLPRL
jgi:AraC-like DNA-binding protein